MITTQQIQDLIQRESDENQVLSVYLDMSVNSDNKRTHHVFLSKEKARFAELDSDREKHHREPLGEAFARIEKWLNEEYNPVNHGVALFASVGGDRFDTLQFRARVDNRLHLGPHPVIGPLTQAVHSQPSACVVAVDREHLRLVALRMGEVLEEHTSSPSAIDTPHDVQAGGYAHKDYQDRKAEETRTFFRQFAEEVDTFARRHDCTTFVLMGTHENVTHFREFLPKQVQDAIVHEGSSPEKQSAAEIARTLHPVFQELALQHQARSLDQVQERVRQSHYATSGLHDTLVQLQEGKVERLVVSSDLSREGVQCTQCGFYLVRRDGACPYCGGSLRNGVDLVESMIRIAASQAVEVDYAPADRMEDMKGVAALLKF